MANKTNKSYTKRISISKNGKLSVRKKGQNHFNGKKSGQQRIDDRSTQILELKPSDKARFLPHA
ncbi:50S ribosomal protein L35 [Candidatus Nomurabacteria bacterium]|nr:50S ribosomal protein L35 [Candidatus Nomurabacteria bacterium]